MSEQQGQQSEVKATVNAGYLTNVFESLAGVRDEGKIKFTDKGIFAKVAGPSNAMMAVCKVEGQALNGITVKGDDEVLMGSKYEDIYDVLTAFKNSSELQVEYPHVVDGSHAIRFYSPDEEMEFKVTVLDVDSVEDMPQTSPLSHKRRVVVSGTDMKKAITNAGRYVSDSDSGIELGTKDGAFYISSSDKVEGEFRKKFYPSGPSGDADLGNVESSIGHPLIDEIKGVIGSADTVTVHIADSNPVRLDIDLDESGDAKIIYIIAPRIESE